MYLDSFKKNEQNMIIWKYVLGHFLRNSVLICLIISILLTLILNKNRKKLRYPSLRSKFEVSKYLQIINFKYVYVVMKI